MAKVAAWSIGEYGDLMLSWRDDGTVRDEEEESEVLGAVAEPEIIAFFQKAIFSSLSSVASKNYLLTALAKLSTRFADADKFHHFPSFRISLSWDLLEGRSRA